MPLHEHFLADLNLMLVLGTGSVTAHDFITLVEGEYGARSARDQDVLVDLRRIEALVIEPDALARLVAHDVEQHNTDVFMRGRRRVVLGRGDLEDAMTQLYRAMLARRPDAAPVAAGTVSFRRLEDALTFLQRDDARARVEEELETLAREAGS